LQHSVPALKLLPPFFRTAWGKADIRAWHRPGLAAPIEPAWTFGALPAASNRARTATGTVVAQVVRSAKRLSLRDAASEYVLLEYSEEHPLVLMNAGMATFIHQVYRRAGPKDPVPPVDAAGYGSLKVLEPGEPGPFWIFGDVEPGRVLPAIQNNLFRAPLFEHAPSGTDFLAIRAHQKGRAGSRLYLRALPPKLLLAGQTFPTAQVFGPHSRKHNNYCRGRIQVFAYRLLAKDVAALQSGMQPRLRISRILAAFPLFSEGSVRKWLKEYADSLRGGKDSGVWVRKPDAPVLGEDSLRALVTPEAVCVYEAMLAGQQRLADAGFVLASAEADEEPGEDHLDEGGAGEVQLAPWHLTANLANAIIGKSALQVRGPGEPSGGRGEAFSFARMPTRMANNGTGMVCVHTGCALTPPSHL
jgi:transcription initiation factor TFIID subunit 1